MIHNERALIGWYLTIASRWLYDEAQRRKRQAPLKDEFAVEPSFARHFSDRETAIEYLSILSMAEREVILLHNMLDFTVDESARICHVTRNTVKDRLGRGMRCMRRY